MILPPILRTLLIAGIGLLFGGGLLYWVYDLGRNGGSDERAALIERSTNLQIELDNLKSTEYKALPTLLTNLNRVSARLNNQLQNESILVAKENQIRQLNRRIEELSVQASTLKTQLTNVQSQNRRLRAEVEQTLERFCTESDCDRATVSIGGGVVYFGERRIPVSITGASEYFSTVDVYVNGTPSSLQSGESIDVEVADGTCTVLLEDLKINSDSNAIATFYLRCGDV